ncbi:hypothetical protein ACFIOY_38700 [Bradyrhizobium sp. TZ2]
MVGTAPTRFCPPYGLLFRFVRNGYLDARLQPNNPTGKSLQDLSIPSHKNIPLNPSGKSMLFLRVSHPIEGRIAIVTNVRWDAVDATTARDERCCLRTAKSCGPDAAVLASNS